MREWTPDQWAAILTAAISAVAAAIVSIIQAIQGKRLQRSLDAQSDRLFKIHSDLIRKGQ